MVEGRVRWEGRFWLDWAVASRCKCARESEATGCDWVVVRTGTGPSHPWVAEHYGLTSAPFRFARTFRVFRFSQRVG